MVVGVPKEIKVGEQRVALTPAGARAFAEVGHRVLIEANAGGGSGFRDDDYARAGAVVTEGKTFPDNTLILGAPAKAVR